MKKLLLTLISLAVCAGVHAAGFMSMEFVKTDGTSHLISLDKLEITVTDGVLSAQSANGSLSFPVAELASMAFTDKISSVDAIKAEAAHTEVTVYGIDGVAHGTYSTATEAAKALAPGNYILQTTDGSTTKINVR